MPDTSGDESGIVLTGGGRTNVVRYGRVVHRDSGPWSATVLDLLRFLHGEGFLAAPQVVEPGFDVAGKEMLTFAFVAGVLYGLFALTGVPGWIPQSWVPDLPGLSTAS